MVVRLRGVGSMSYSWFGERFFIIINIVEIMMVIMFFCHLLACFWYAVGTEGVGDNWVAHFGYRSEPWHELYLISFLCAICQIAGEITLWPQGLVERVYLIFTTVICY